MDTLTNTPFKEQISRDAFSASLTPMFMSIISTRARYRIWDMKKSVQKHLRNQFCFRMVHNYLVR